MSTEKHIIRIIQKYQRDHGKAPTLRDIAKGTNTSIQYVHRLIKKLIAEKKIADKLYTILEETAS